MTLESTPAISVIIVAFHSGPVLENCIRSLPGFFGSTPFEVIVVNNGGDAPPPDQDWGIEVKYLDPGRNLGFGGGANLGAQCALASILFFLNPDSEISGGNARIAVDFLDSHPEAGILGFRVASHDGWYEPASARYQPLFLSTTAFLLGLSRVFPGVKAFSRYYYPNSSSDEPFLVEAVSGAAFMILKDVFIHVGDFDSDYFLFGEDLDLCYKVLNWTNMKIYHHPRLRIAHTKGASMRTLGFLKARYHMFRSMGVYFRKHSVGGRGWLAFVLAPLLWITFAITMPISYFRWRSGARTLR